MRHFIYKILYLVLTLVLFILYFTWNIFAFSAEKPQAPYGVKSLSAYESRIGEPGVLIEDPDLEMWVPKKDEENYRIVFKYLEDGYQVLKNIYGGHDMSFKFSVEQYPFSSPYFLGGTDGVGTIRYGYSTLTPEDVSTEWKIYKIPHVIGYYEEMAHCFLRQFEKTLFYEAIGSMIGSETSMRASWNPYYAQEFYKDGLIRNSVTTRYYLKYNTGEPGVSAEIYLTRILAYIFQTEVVDVYGWKAFTKTFEILQQNGYPLLSYNPNHSWGGFIEYLGNVIGKDLHTVFGDYGLPIFQWTGEPGYESDGIEIISGTNRYRFRIKICDREGDQPANVMLHIYKSGRILGEPLIMSFIGGNAHAGWIYQTELEISEPNIYEYAFSAYDGVHNKVFQAVGKPTVKTTIIAQESNKINPELPFHAEPGPSWCIVTHGTMCFINGGGFIYCLEMSDPTHPRQIGQIFPEKSIVNMCYFQDRLYVACGFDGFIIIDVKDPNKPEIIGQFPTPEGAMGVSISWPYAVIAEYLGGINIIDVSKPQSLRSIGKMELPILSTSVSVYDRTAFVSGKEESGENRIYAIDFASPELPVSKGFWKFFDYIADIDICERYVVAAQRDRRLGWFPINESVKGNNCKDYQSPDCGYAYGIGVADRNILLATGTGGLHIFRFGAEGNVKDIGFCQENLYAGEVATLGHFALVTDGHRGLKVVDLSPITELTHYQAYDKPISLKVIGSFEPMSFR